MDNEAGTAVRSPLARQFRVGWKPRVAEEFAATFPLLPHEQEVLRGLVSSRRLAISGGPALVLLTDRRLCILVHYALRFDRGIECGRGSVLGIESTRVLRAFAFFRLRYRTGSGFQSFDFGRVTAVSPAVAAIGWEVMAPEDLIAQLRSTWCQDAPGVNSA